MFEQHRNRDGSTILIGQMSDAALIGYTMGILRNCVRLRHEAENPDSLKPFQRALYGLKTVTDPERAAREVRQGLSVAMPYLCEIFLRGLDAPNVRSALQAVAGRTGAIVPVESGRILMDEGHLDHYSDDDDGDGDYGVDDAGLPF